MADSMVLLFFDTFSHDNSEDLNLDLVQFPRPVFINEVRIIPLGSRVQADVPGGHRLGATNPSVFDLEFFVNNLSKPNSATFEKLGSLDYKENVEIQLLPNIKVPTDGLILRGWYRTITLAVLGSPTVVIKDRASPPPPPPPQTVQRSKPIIAIERSPIEREGLIERVLDWEREVSKETRQQLPFPDSVHHISVEDQYEDHHKEVLQDPRDTNRDRYLDDRDYSHKDYDRNRDKKFTKDYREKDYRETSDYRDKDSREYRERNYKDYREKDREHSRERESSRESRDYKDRDYGRDSRDREHLKRDSESQSREMSWDAQRSDNRARTRSPRRTPSPKCTLSPVSPDKPPDDAEPGELGEELLSDEMFEALTPDQPSLYNLSDGEIPEAEGADDLGTFEEILSDEEDMSDIDEHLDLGDYDMSDDAWNFVSTSFNPYQSEMGPLAYFYDPSFTPYEIEKFKLLAVSEELGHIPEMPEAAKKLFEITDAFITKEHTDKWVETMECLPSLIPDGLPYILFHLDRDDVLDQLIVWTVEGLDFKKALEQPHSVYKVRHLKAGIRMAGLMCSLEGSIAQKMLFHEVQNKLLDLFHTEHMSLSLKLQIIKALDATVRLKEGMDHMLGLTSKINSDSEMLEPDQKLKIKWTGYQRVLDILLTKQSTRTAVAVSALVTKMHTYEVLQKLSASVELVVENSALLETEISPKVSSDLGENYSPGLSLDADLETLISAIGDQVLDSIIECLEEITRCLINCGDTMVQPRRSLPAKVQFEILTNPNDPYPALFSMFHTHRLLECVFVLLSSPITLSHTVISTSIRDLLQQLLQTQRGMLYLSTKPDTINGIIRTLTQNSGWEFVSFSPKTEHGKCRQEEIREETTDENPSQQLGLQLIYHLQTLQFIDALLEFHAKDASKKEVDDPEVLAILHMLNAMTFTPLGKASVVYVISLDQNLNAVIPFVELTGDSDQDMRIRKSASAGYATQLLLMIVKHSENVTMLEIFAEKLIEINESEATSKITELSNWLEPCKKISSYNYEAVPHLIGCLRLYMDDILNLPAGLITTLRILKHICVTPEVDFKHEDHQEELKYKYCIIQLYTCDAFPAFITILEKLGEMQRSPWQQGIPPTNSQVSKIMGILKPVLALIKHMLSYLIHCRNTEFCDLTSLPALLNIHTIMCSIPGVGIPPHDAYKIQSDIVDILLAFTQPSLKESESDEALSNSLWTLMVKQILQYVPAAPYTFMGGLILLSELLPLSLPLQTREPLTKTEIELVINSRKLWSAHLHSLGSLIQDIIKTLAGSSCQPLQDILRRVSVQLADLAAPTALVVVRALLDVLIESLESPLEQKEEIKEEELSSEQDKGISGHTSRILNLLAYLISNAAIKAPIMQLFRSSTKTDEKYAELFYRLLTLLNLVSEKPSHIQAQECIVSIVQSMCDTEITLMTGEPTLTPLEQLSNSLPNKEQMTLICSSLLEHINTSTHSYASLLPSLRTLVMLTEHDYGFYHLKCALEKHSSTFYNLFKKLTSSFSKDSSDCLSTLSTTNELLRLLLHNEYEQAQMRTFTLTVSELQTILQWPFTEGTHPLEELEKMLADCSREEETLESLQENISSLIQLLKDGTNQQEKMEFSEPILPAPESLSSQFNSRATFLIGDIEDDRWSPLYWLSNPAADDSDVELDQVVVDLESMNEKYCPEYDLKGELNKGSIRSDREDAPIVKPKKKPKGWKDRCQPLINPNKKDRAGKKAFPRSFTSARTPWNPQSVNMRGRGFSHTVSHSNRSNDPFRSRPPNTSRPPSMHVDDFQAMEHHHPPPSQPALKRNPKVKQREINRGRGRGFENSRGFSNSRGRFFSPQTNYSRRDLGSQRSWSSRPNVKMSKINFGNSRDFGHGSRGTMARTSMRELPYRFPRGRPSHWLGPRGKDSDSRFISIQNLGGRGRREIIGRHTRSFTR